MLCNALRTNILYTFLFLSFALTTSAQVSVDAGKTIFSNVCASCHARDMKTAATGPALSGYADAWGDYPREDLYSWIRNSQALISTGHPRAVELWALYKPTVMTNNLGLTDDDIESVLAYVDCKIIGGPECTVAVVNGGGDVVGAAGAKKSNSWMYWLIFALLGGLALFLSRVINNMGRIAAAKEGVPYTGKTLAQTLTSKSMITFGIFALVILGGYTTVTRAMNLGRQQAYAPEQPINFSHETHAGLHKIECQYCHDGARRSKHAVIPATNTCMNCHAAIKIGSEHGTAELTKIYASAGYDPSTNKYIENYDDLSEDEIKAIFTKWIGDSYILENGIAELDKEGERVVADQWKGLVSSLTNEQKKKIQGPIEWTRIHNLPDHVYFSHAQHVTVGKLECQQCHGPVEEMDLVEQHAPLSMGWCINCHRETEVQFKDNEYYDSYMKYHEELASGERDKVTVEDIGGLECQKCHY